jgi:3-oxoacyl-[acyl-carrier-protein] synthase III
MDVYFGHPQFILGQAHTVEELYARGFTASTPDELRAFGFERNGISESSAYHMAKTVGERVLNHTPIQELYYDACFTENLNVSTPSQFTERVLMEHFMNYPAMNLCKDLGLKQLKYYGLSQQGCSGLFGCIELACRSIRCAGRPHTALCITSEKVPGNCFYDRPEQRLLHSDAASGCLVSNEPLAYRILGTASVSKADLDAKMLELLLAFASLTKQVLKQNPFRIEEIENVFTPNFWPDFWDRLVSLIKGDPHSLQLDNLKASAHAFSSDFIINLTRRELRGLVHSGHAQLAYGYGYGSHLYCLLFRKM